MDPTYVGATGHYVDLGAGYDRKALFAQRQEIVAAVQAYRSYYPQAYRRLPVPWRPTAEEPPLSTRRKPFRKRRSGRWPY